jgi:hypothetical protein
MKKSDSKKFVFTIHNNSKKPQHNIVLFRNSDDRIFERQYLSLFDIGSASKSDLTKTESLN